MKKLIYISIMTATLISVSSCRESLMNEQSDIKLNQVCNLVEDLESLKQFVFEKVGSEITDLGIDKLNNYFDIIKDEQTMDALYSRSDQVRFAGLNRKCVAPDKIKYEYFIGVITDLSGNAIYSQFYLIYDKGDLLEGRRDFSFKNIFGTKKDYIELLSKNMQGMNKEQVDNYMAALDSYVKETDHQGLSKTYIYKVEGTDLASRIGFWDFSMQIKIDFDDSGIFSQLSVR